MDGYRLVADLAPVMAYLDFDTSMAAYCCRAGKVCKLLELASAYTAASSRTFPVYFSYSIYSLASWLISRTISLSILISFLGSALSFSITILRIYSSKLVRSHTFASGSLLIASCNALFSSLSVAFCSLIALKNI